MADTTKRVIIDITLPEVERRLNALNEIKKSMDDLRVKQQELRKAGEENSKQYQANEAELRALNAQYRQGKSELDNFVKAAMSSTGSLDQMKAAVSVLNREFSSMSEAERTGTARGQELAKQITELNTKINETKLGVNDSTSNIGKYEQATVSFRQQVRELSNQLYALEQQGKGNTAEYKIMVQKLGELKDTMSDVQGRAKFFSDDARWITMASQAVQGLVGAYAVYRGVVALTGEENKELQKTMMKLQALMSIMIGLKQVEAMVNKDSAVKVGLMVLAEKARAIQLAVSTKAQIANTVATETGTIAAKASAAAWKVLNTVMKSNVIGVILTAATALAFILYKVVRGQNDWSVAMQKATNHSQTFNEWQEKNIESHKKANEGFIEETANMKVLFGVAEQSINDKKEYKVAIDAINTAYGQYLPKLLTEKSTLQDLEAAYENVVKAMRAKMSAEIAMEAAKESMKSLAIAQKEEYMLKARILNIRRLGEYIEQVGEGVYTIADLSPSLQRAIKDMSDLGLSGNIVKGGTAWVAKLGTTTLAMQLLTKQLQTNEGEQEIYNNEVDKSIQAGIDATKMLDGLTFSHKNNSKALKDQNEFLQIDIELVKKLRAARQLLNAEPTPEPMPPMSLEDEFAQIDSLNKERLRLEQKYYELKKQTAKEGTEEETKILLEQERIRYEEEKAEYIKRGDILEEIEKVHQQNIEKIKQDAFSRWMAAHQEEIDAVKSGLQNIADALGQYYDYKNAKEKASFDDYEKLQDDERKALKKRFDQGALSQEQYDRRIAQLDEEKDRRQRKLARDAAKRAKTQAIMNATIAGISATLQAYQSGMAYPFVGPATGAIFAALAAAFAAAQIALIAATPLPSAARGRRIRGNSHATGGEVIEAEADETVMNKKASRRFLPYLDLFQRTTGGVPFVNDGGYSAAMAAQKISGGSGLTAGDLANLKIYVTVDDINRGINRVNVIQSRANV